MRKSDGVLTAVGFLITQMGSASGGAPGRVAEFDRNLQLVKEWPDNPPLDGFNPHGISARPELNLLVTSDFIDPASTLNGPGDPVLRGAIRVWEFNSRTIIRTVQIPTAIGTMDVRLIPGDPLGRAYTAGMFDGFVYLIDTFAGTAHLPSNAWHAPPFHWLCPACVMFLLLRPKTGPSGEWLGSNWGWEPLRSALWRK